MLNCEVDLSKKEHETREKTRGDKKFQSDSNLLKVTDMFKSTNDYGAFSQKEGKMLESTDESKSDDVDEGYFDSSYVESTDFAIGPTPEPDIKKDTNTTNISNIINLLKEDMKFKLCLSGFEHESKRPGVNVGCQTNNESSLSSNKMFVLMKNDINKREIEKDALSDKMSQLQKKCSKLDLERLSLLAQTEALQTECVRNMHDNDKLHQKIEQRSCHVATLKETLLFRDKEIHLLRKQDNSPTTLNQINDYRELEMLGVDNIRLLHDNRALTATLDSLNGQLCGMRRITRSYDDSSDSVIMMNARLAEDNNALYRNLSAVKKELKSLNQEHQVKLREVRSLRVDLKRSSAEVLATEALSPENGSVAEENKVLVRQNSKLNKSVDSLKDEVEILHSQLRNIRSVHQAFNKVVAEKSELQQQLQDVEAQNTELWSRVSSLQSQEDESHVKSRVKSHDPHEEESRDLMRSKEETSEGLSERVKLLEDRLNQEIGKNADMAKKIEELHGSLDESSLSIQELQCTVEFLQVEHSVLQDDMGRKDESINELKTAVKDLNINKDEVVVKCKAKLKDKTRKLNASRIKLGHALLEARELKSRRSFDD